MTPPELPPFDSTLAFNTNEQKLFDRALALYSKRRYQEALPLFQQITSESLVVLKHYYLGLTLVQLGEFHQALTHYRKIREIPAEVHSVDYDRLIYGLYINMGSVLQAIARHKEKEMLEEAATCYTYALDIQQTDARLWNNLGNCYLDLSHYSEATRCFTQAISLDDDFPEAHYCQSLVHEFTSHYPEAIEELKLALRLNTRNQTYLKRLTALLFSTGKMDEALIYANQIVQNNPDSADAHKNLALILYNLNHFEDAWVHYKKLKLLNPNYADPETRTIFQDLSRRIRDKK